jgi:hypothetical protein
LIMAIALPLSAETVVVRRELKVDGHAEAGR